MGIAKKKSAYGSMTLTTAGQTVAKNVDPTSHWKSTYKGVVDSVTEQDRIISRIDSKFPVINKKTITTCKQTTVRHVRTVLLARFVPG